MDEAACFLKELFTSFLAEEKKPSKRKKKKKKSKTRLTIASFVKTAGEKVVEPLVIRRSAKPVASKTLKILIVPEAIIITLTKNYGL